MYGQSAYFVIDQNSLATDWDGSPATLNPNENIMLPQTTNGSMVFAYENKATENNQGKISLTSGGSRPIFLTAPALANQPSVLVKNWQANNLSVTNISPPGSATPIWIAAIGPGLPGQKPTALPVDGSQIQLSTYQSAQGNALPQWMQLVFQSNTSMLTIFAIVGGPLDSSGNNAYVIALNDAQNSGGDSDAAALPGYYATTTSNVYTFEFNWGSSAIFVANLSPETAAAGQVSVRPL